MFFMRWFLGRFYLLAALFIACSDSRRNVVEADSTRMVNAVLREVSVSDVPGRRACYGKDRLRHVDTGQAPCEVAPFIVTRLVAFRTDSIGACVWIEHQLPAGGQVLDGGPLGIPVTRAGE